MHQIFSFGNHRERLCALERMTDERRSIRQISGNLREFQAPPSELKHVTPKAVIYQRSVEGRVGAPAAWLVPSTNCTLSRKCEEFRPRTNWSLPNACALECTEVDPIPHFKATAILVAFLVSSSHARSSLWVVWSEPPFHLASVARRIESTLLPTDFPEGRLNEAASRQTLSRVWCRQQ